MQSDIVQRLDDWRGEMQRTIKALESNPKFADVVEGNRAIHTTLGMAKTEILFSRTTIANQSEAMRASDAEITRLTEALRAAEERAGLLQDGWVLVPEEPTWEMLEAARDGLILNPKMDALMKRGLRANWKAMIRAALKGPSHD